MRRRRLSVFLAVAVVGPAAPAVAADRFVAPDGAGSSCTEVSPCALPTGLSGADPGDVLKLEGGDYTVIGGPLDVPAVTVQPLDASPVKISSAGPVFNVIGAANLQRLTLEGASTVLAVGAVAGVQLSDLVITQTAGTGPALTSASPDLVAQRLRVSGADGVSLTAGTPLLANSYVTATDADGVAVRAATADGARLLHVTALAPGATGVALRLDSGAILVRNSILRAGGPDVEVVAGTVTAEHSNFSDTTGTVTGAPNQADDPQLTDGQPSATSPVLGAATADAAAGPADVAGAPRIACGAPDIGAFERQACPPGPNPDPDPDPDPDPQPQQPTPQPQQPGPTPPVIQQPGPITFPGLLVGDFVDPTIRNLRARADRRRRVSVTLRTSEPVLVRFVIERRIDGRRAGGRCVAGRRRGARCTRYVVVRRVTRQLRAGSVKANLGSLRSAVYRVTARAQDAARNQSVRKRATVRVRARR